MKIVRHAIFIAVVAVAADATANGGTEMRSVFYTAAPSTLVAKAKLAGHHFREDMRRFIGDFSGR